ncbi:MAG: AsmA-like C-terminal region-containing protein [Deferrisomatales bacterium]|nr:AsmA-like C-terminal region-containing protein [Deferrisomatales bacterium]
MLDAIDSRVSDFALDRPVPFALSARLPLAEAGRFSAEGTVHAAAGDAKAKVRVADFDLPSLNPLLEGDLRFDAGSFGLDLDVELTRGEQVAVRGTAGARRLILGSGSQTGESADISLQLDAGADLSEGTAEVRRFELQAAGQRLEAEARVRGLQARPRIDFRLSSDELRVDPLTALLPAGDAAPAAPPAGETPPSAPSPTSIPLDAFGDVAVGRLSAGGAVVEDFQARVELDKGVLRVEPAAANLYGGTLKLRSRAELEKAGPPFDAGLELAGTQLSSVLAAFRPALRDTASGTLDLTLEARGSGGDVGALRSQLKAEAKDGRILNHPLAANLAALFQVKELESLNFYNLRADVETAEGVGQVRSVVFRGPNLQATATGTLGLADGALDLRLAVALPQELAARLVREPTTLQAVTDADGWSRLPLRLRGTLESPSYGLDAEGLRDAAAKALGDKAQQVLEEKVLERLPVGEQEREQIQEGLRRLLGR